MRKFQDIVIYYILLFLGLASTSWIIWGRFIRERTIRDIPDEFFTELRFWILLYICFLYLYVVKSLIKPKEPHEIFKWLSNSFTVPLITLDNFIKYNRYVKSYYYKLISIIINYLDDWDGVQIQRFLLLFDVIPRVILVSFLLFDTIYLKKLELFYKVILMGLVPFILRYSLYSLKDVEDHWVIILDQKYDFILVYEKGYESLACRKRDTKAKYHFEKVSTKEYIEIKYNNIKENIYLEDFPYEYVGRPIAKEAILMEYNNNKYHTNEINLIRADYEEISKSFHELIPYILKVKMFSEAVSNTKQFPIIKYFKITIFILYFLCWSFILITSQYHYPVEFALFKNFIFNLMVYLMILDDPFSMELGYSLNENLFTKENIIFLLDQVLHNIFKHK